MIPDQRVNVHRGEQFLRQPKRRDDRGDLATLIHRVGQAVFLRQAVEVGLHRGNDCLCCRRRGRFCLFQEPPFRRCLVCACRCNTRYHTRSFVGHEKQGGMAGHSKWANIQHRKGAQDKKRGKLFTKLIREITIAAKMGGSDLDANPRLRLAVDKAKAQSMPKDNIERAIKRGAGETEGADYLEISYEGYGPGGTAVMVHCLTDNRNRTVADVRHAFTKFGGNLGADGSVRLSVQPGRAAVVPGGQ